MMRAILLTTAIFSIEAHSHSSLALIPRQLRRIPGHPREGRNDDGTLMLSPVYFLTDLLVSLPVGTLSYLNC